jgi:cysteine synthase
MEGANPGGSVKDRPALAIVNEYASHKLIGSGGAFVDSTSGNFGVAMSWICKALGYRFHAVTDIHATVANIARMRSLDARVDIIDEPDETGSYLLSRIARAKELARSGEGHWLDQYTNPINPEAHFRTTACEIVDAFPEPLDLVLVSASTGGTLAGVSRRLKRDWPSCRVVAVDGEGSALFGGTPGPRRINGLGSSGPSPFLRDGLYDSVVQVDARSAVGYARYLADAGIARVGGSSGAAVAAAVRLLAESESEVRALVLCPDHGDLYLDTIFDRSWMPDEFVPEAVLTISGGIDPLTDVIVVA